MYQEYSKSRMVFCCIGEGTNTPFCDTHVVVFLLIMYVIKNLEIFLRFFYQKEVILLHDYEFSIRTEQRFI